MNIGFNPPITASRMPTAGSAPSQIARCRANRLEGNGVAPSLRVTESRTDEIEARIGDLLKNAPPRNGDHRGKEVKLDIESMPADIPIFV